jgi:hypothetical protein
MLSIRDKSSLCKYPVRLLDYAAFGRHLLLVPIANLLWVY